MAAKKLGFISSSLGWNHDKISEIPFEIFGDLFGEKIEEDLFSQIKPYIIYEVSVK